jgi:hypothetical protein
VGVTAAASVLGVTAAARPVREGPGSAAGEGLAASVLGVRSGGGEARGFRGLNKTPDTKDTRRLVRGVSHVSIPMWRGHLLGHL